MTAAVAVQSPEVQGRLVRELISRFSEKIGGRISFSSVNFQAPGTISIKDVLIIDDDPYTADKFNTGYTVSDTLLYARSVNATVSSKMLLSGKGIHLSRIGLNGASIFLAMEPYARHGMNFSRVLGLAGSDSTSKTPPVSVGIINGEDIRFRMSDFQRLPRYYAPGSINYEHVDAHVSTMTVRNLNIKDGQVSGVLEDAAISEKCGADVKVSTRMKAGNGVVMLRDIIIRDSLTDLHAPLYSMTKTPPEAYRHYCREVRMRLKVAKGSIVSSKTISRFSKGRLDNMDFRADTLPIKQMLRRCILPSYRHNRYGRNAPGCQYRQIGLYFQRGGIICRKTYRQTNPD